MATTTFSPMAPYQPSAMMVHSNPFADPVDFDGDGNEGWDGESEFDEFGYIDEAYGAFGGVNGRAKRRKKLQEKVKKAKAQGKTAKAKKLQYRLAKLEAKMKLKGDPGMKGAKKAPAKKKPATAAERAKAKKEQEAEDAEDAAEEKEDAAVEKEAPSAAAAPEAANLPEESSEGGSNKGLLIGGGLAAVGLIAGLAFLAMRKKE
jgi:hypothetical protein